VTIFADDATIASIRLCILFLVYCWFVSFYYSRSNCATDDAGDTGEGAVVLSLADDVSSWQPGDQIVIASSDYDMTHAEVFTLIDCPTCTAYQLKLNGWLIYINCYLQILFPIFFQKTLSNKQNEILTFSFSCTIVQNETMVLYDFSCNLVLLFVKKEIRYFVLILLQYYCLRLRA